MKSEVYKTEYKRAYVWVRDIILNNLNILFNQIKHRKGEQGPIRIFSIVQIYTFVSKVFHKFDYFSLVSTLN